MTTVNIWMITSASAFDSGLIFKDTKIGTIDTDTFSNCVGAAITCDNDNTVNNHIATNYGTNGPVDLTCEECLAALTPEQLSMLQSALELQSTRPDRTCLEILEDINTNPHSPEYAFCKSLIWYIDEYVTYP